MSLIQQRNDMAIEEHLLDCIRRHCGLVISHHFDRFDDDNVDIYAVVQNGPHLDAWVASGQRNRMSSRLADGFSWTVDISPEWELPCRFRMPRYLLDMLTLPSAESAAEWREICRQREVAVAAGACRQSPPSVGDLLTVDRTDHDIPLVAGLPLLRCEAIDGDHVQVAVLDATGATTGRTYRLFHDQVRPVGPHRPGTEPDRLDRLIRYQKGCISAMKAGILAPLGGLSSPDVWGHRKFALPNGATWEPFDLDTHGGLDGVGAYEEWLERGLVFVAVGNLVGTADVNLIVGRSPDGSIVALGGNRKHREKVDPVRFAVEAALRRPPLILGRDYIPNVVHEGIFEPAPSPELAPTLH